MPICVQIVDRRAQADGRHDRRRAGFELGGQLGRLEALGRDAADHAAAAQERRHRFEQFAPAIEHADARGPEHLVAAEGQKVGAQRADVDLLVRHALGRVDQHQRAGRVRAATISASGLIVPSTFETAATATMRGARGRETRSSASRSSRPSSVIGRERTHAPVRARRPAARERCSSGAPSRSAEFRRRARRFASPQLRATRLMLSVVPWVKITSRRRAAPMNACTLSRASSYRSVL